MTILLRDGLSICFHHNKQLGLGELEKEIHDDKQG
jgi:hypothetical protein